VAPSDTKMEKGTFIQTPHQTTSKQRQQEKTLKKTTEIELGLEGGGRGRGGALWGLLTLFGKEVGIVGSVHVA